MARYAIPYEMHESGVVYIDAESEKDALARLGDGDYQDEKRGYEYDKEGIRKLRD